MEAWSWTWSYFGDSLELSIKDKKTMEGTIYVTRLARASIKSTSIVIGGNVTTEVADEAEASSDSDLDDTYVAPVDPVSSSGDEFDNDEE